MTDFDICAEFSKETKAQALMIHIKDLVYVFLEVFP